MSIKWILDMHHGLDPQSEPAEINIRGNWHTTVNGVEWTLHCTQLYGEDKFLLFYNMGCTIGIGWHFDAQEIDNIGIGMIADIIYVANVLIILEKMRLTLDAKSDLTLHNEVIKKLHIRASSYEDKHD